MSKIALIALASMCAAVACKDRTYGEGSRVKDASNGEPEMAMCAFACPPDYAPAGSPFQTQKFLCEKGTVKTTSSGYAITGTIDGAVVEWDLGSDVKVPRCPYKLVVVEANPDGLAHPEYPALTPKLNKKEIFEGLYKRLIPLKAALTDDAQWGVLRVNDETYLIKQVARIRSLDGVGVYHLAGGYPDKPQTDSQIILELFRFDGKLVIQAKALMGL
jgi:hypothetical protein